MKSYKEPCFIFARGGSKGLVNKNIKPLNGKPLIAYSIEEALKVKNIDRVIVSTDSEEIAEVARKYHAEVPFLRPSHLASDDSPEWLSWQHALSFLNEKEGRIPEKFISVPTTSPLRSYEDIQNCIVEFDKGGADSIITVTEASRSPYFNMVKEADDGFIDIIIKKGNQIFRRQDAPSVYDVTTVAYVISSKFIMEHNGIFEGKVRKVLVPSERSLDIDNEYDFKIAEYMIKHL